MKILIVDDSEQMRRTVRSFVCDSADESFEACDGAEALAAYRRHLPDWVLMDIKMRAMNGLQATREILDAFPDARVVIVSHYDDAALRASATAAGACGYVLKENLLDLRPILDGRKLDVH